MGTINLVVGKLSGFVEDSVRFYFDFLAKGTIAEGADLKFTSVSPQAKCRSCGKPFDLEELDWSCPECGGSDIEITAGRELSIESIDIE